MKREKVGFAIMLMGVIFAVPGALFWWIGLALGIVGLCLVVSSR